MLSFARVLKKYGRSGGTCESDTCCKKVERKCVLVILWKGIRNGFQSKEACVGKWGGYVGLFLCLGVQIVDDY